MTPTEIERWLTEKIFGPYASGNLTMHDAVRAVEELLRGEMT